MNKNEEILTKALKEKFPNGTKHLEEYFYDDDLLGAVLNAILASYEKGVEDTKEETREWLIGEDYEMLAEKI